MKRDRQNSNHQPSRLVFRYAKAALRAGKHVLVEKPLTSNAAEARVLARIARSRGLVLAEGYHW